MSLETLTCILLYLNVMVSPGTYSVSEVGQFETDHSPEISEIHTDPTFEAAVVQTFQPQLEFIEIVDAGSWD